MDIDYLKRAEEWNDRAKTEKDLFVKFILLFISLEVLVGLKELGKVWRLKSQPTLLKSLKMIDRGELITTLKIEPLRNEDPEGDQRWDGVIRGTEDWDGFVDFLVRARNNLFHGDKGLNSKRDLFVVAWGNKLLAPLVQELITQTKK